MRLTKKALAIVLTLLMVFSSISLLAQAIYDDGYFRTVAYRFDFVDEYGNETTKVYPGQTVTARLYLKTDFVGAANAFYVLYDKSVLSIDDCEDVAFGSGAVNSYDTDQRDGLYDADAEGTGLVSADCLELELIPADTFDTYGSIYINGKAGISQKFRDKDSEGNDLWTYSIDFTVNDDIDETSVGRIFIPTTSAAGPENIDKKTRICRIDAGIEGDDYEDGREPFDWDPVFEIECMGIESTLTLAAEQGDTAEQIETNSALTYDGVDYVAPYLSLGEGPIYVNLYLPGDGMIDYSDEQYEAGVGDITWEYPNVDWNGKIKTDGVASGRRKWTYTSLETPQSLEVTPAQNVTIANFDHGFMMDHGASQGASEANQNTWAAFDNYTGVEQLVGIPDDYYFFGWVPVMGNAFWDAQFEIDEGISDGPNPYIIDPASVSAEYMASAPGMDAVYLDEAGLHDYTGLGTAGTQYNGEGVTSETNAVDAASAVMKRITSANYGSYLYAVDDGEGGSYYQLDLVAVFLPVPTEVKTLTYKIYPETTTSFVEENATATAPSAKTDVVPGTSYADNWLTSEQEAALAKAHYKLKWYSDAACQYELSKEATITDSVTVYGKYERTEYTLNYKVYAETETEFVDANAVEQTDLKKEDVVKGKKYSEVWLTAEQEAALAKTDYTLNWYSDAACTTALDKTAAINSDVTVYGKYTEKKYKINFVYADPTAPDDRTKDTFVSASPDYSAGASLAELSAPDAPTVAGYSAADGYEFNWGSIPSVMPSGGATVVGNFSKLKYDIVWRYQTTVASDAEFTDLDSKTGIEWGTVIAGIEKEADPAAKTGYDFKWYTKDGDVYTALADGAQLKANTTLYGRYTPHTNDILWIAIDKDGDETPIDTTYDVAFGTDITDYINSSNENYVANTATVNDHYHFDSWKFETLTQTEGKYLMPDDDVRIVVSEHVDKYTVKFTAGPEGATVNDTAAYTLPNPVPYDEETNFDDVLGSTAKVYKGYKFADSFNEGDYNLNSLIAEYVADKGLTDGGKIELTLDWELDYTLVFVAGDEVFVTYGYTDILDEKGYGDTFTFEEDMPDDINSVTKFEMTGHTYTGWSPVADSDGYGVKESAVESFVLSTDLFSTDEDIVDVFGENAIVFYVVKEAETYEDAVINYAPNGGKFTADGSTVTKTVSGDFTFDEKLTDVPAITKEGYEFDGWKLTDPETDGAPTEKEPVLANDLDDDSVTYTAQWTAKTFTPDAVPETGAEHATVYKSGVKFDAAGGTFASYNGSVLEATYDEEISAPAVTKAGCYLDGWTTTANDESTKLDPIKLTKELASGETETYYALWKSVTYTPEDAPEENPDPNTVYNAGVYFYPYASDDDDLIKDNAALNGTSPVGGAYGDKVSAVYGTSYPTCTGYVFTGWKDQDGNVLSKDFKLNSTDATVGVLTSGSVDQYYVAQWTALTFVPDDEPVNPDDADPAKKYECGLIFNPVNGDKQGKIDGMTTAKAVAATFGQAIPVPNVTAPEGFALTGWTYLDGEEQKTVTDAALKETILETDLSTLDDEHRTYTAVYAPDGSSRFTLVVNLQKADLNGYESTEYSCTAVADDAIAITATGVVSGTGDDSKLQYSIPAGYEVSASKHIDEAKLFDDDGVVSKVRAGGVYNLYLDRKTGYPVIAYDEDGTSVIASACAEYAYGQTATEPSSANAVKEGYAFDKWVRLDGSDITFPLEIKEPITVKAVYKGAKDEDNLVKFNFFKENPNEPGTYTEAGSRTSDNGGEGYVTGATVTYVLDANDVPEGCSTAFTTDPAAVTVALNDTVEMNVYFPAAYREIAITFDYAGGLNESGKNTSTVAHLLNGADCAVPEITKDSSTLEGWALSTAPDTIVIAADADTVEVGIADVTYVAVWTHYTGVTFENEDGVISGPVSVDKGEKLDSADIPDASDVPESYVHPEGAQADDVWYFAGWILDGDDSEYVDLDSWTAGNDDENTFTAVYEKITFSPEDGTDTDAVKYNTGVTFAANGGVLAGTDAQTVKVSAKFGEKIENVPKASKAGAIFVGWSTSYDWIEHGGVIYYADDNGNADIELQEIPDGTNPVYYAIYDVCNYRVIYKVAYTEDGEDKEATVYAATRTADDGEYTIPDVDHGIEGYKPVTKWTCGTDEYEVGANFGTITSMVVFTAVLEPETYEITFDPDAEDAEWPASVDNSKVDTDNCYKITVEYGEEIAAPAAPERENYEFEGWDNEVSVCDGTVTTYKATWTPKEYTVTYKYIDENDAEQVIESFDGQIYGVEGYDVAPEFAPEGYVFEGWAEDSEAEEADYTSDDIAAMAVSGDKTFWAVLTRDNTIAVSFYEENGTTPIGEAKTGLTYGDTLAAPAIPEKPGYTGKFVSVDDGSDFDSTVPAESTDYKVEYTVNPDVDYTVNVKMQNPGTNSYITTTETLSAPAGSVISRAVNNSITGYEFNKADSVGAYDETAEEISITLDADAAKNIITIVYDRAEYIVTTDVLGDTSTTYSFGYNDSLVVPDASAEGLTFKGWKYDDDSAVKATDKVTESITIYAQFEGTITYKANGEVAGEYTRDYGMDYPTAPNTTVPGYKAIEKWTDGTTEFTSAQLAEKKVTADAVYDAVLVPRDDITIAFYQPDRSTVIGTPASNYVFDADLTAPEDNKITVPDGKHFVEWRNTADDSAMPDKVPADDASYYAYCISNDSVNYTVDTYIQNVADDNYTLLSTVSPAGVIGTTAVVTIQNFVGYEIETAMIVGEYDSETNTVSIELGNTAANNVIKVYFKRLAYTVTKKFADGTLIGTESFKYNDALKLDEPTKEGYTFVKWTKDDAGNMAAPATVKESMTLYAQFTPVEYTITYVVNGEATENTAAYDSTYPETPAVNVEGYDFEGKWTDGVNEYTTEALEEMTVTGDAEYTAVLTAKTGITLKFLKENYENEDDVIENGILENQTFGTVLNAPAVPAKTGYTGKWVNTADDSDLPATVPAESASYYPVYTLGDSVNYTIRTYIDDVLVSSSALKSPADQDITINMIVNDPSISFNKADSTAPKSYDAATGTYIIKVVDGLTVNIKYVTTKYTVTKKFADGTLIGTESFKYNDALKLAEPTKEGYTFVKWTKDDAGNTAAPATVKENVTLYAQFTPVEYTITYVVNGEATENTAAYDSTYPETPAVDVEGYDFSGKWTDGENEFTTEALEALTVTGDAEYTAILTPKTGIDITFYDENDTELTDLALSGKTFGDELVAPAVPEKAGYTGKWVNTADGSDIPATIPAADAAFKAVYTQGESVNYTVNTYIDGELVSSSALKGPADQDITINIEETAVLAFDKDNSTEAKSYDAETGKYIITVTDGLTVEIKYVTKEYIVTKKNTDDTEIGTESFGYNAKLSLDVPSKDGYTFDKWTTDKAGEEAAPATVTEDITLYAQFTPVEYTITYVVNNEATENKMAYNSTYPAAPAVDVEGYDFGGKWTDGENEYTTEALEALTVTGNAVYTAILTPKTGIDITFYDENDTELTDLALSGKTFGDELVAPAVPEKAGYTGKWVNTADGSDIPATIPAADAAFKAVYTQGESVNYTVNTYIDGELVSSSALKGPADQDITINIEETASLAFDKTNSTTPKSYDTETGKYIITVTDGLTVEIKYVTKEYIVTKKNTDDTEIGTESFGYNAKLSLDVPSKDGYTFDKWTTDKAGEEAAPATVTEDITLYAQFTPVEYTITYVVNNEATENKMAYNSTYPAAPAVDVEGYDFGGWTDGENEYTTDELEALTVTGNAVYTAILTPKTDIALTFYQDIGDDTPIDRKTDLTYGDAITFDGYEDKTAEGLTFDCWTLEDGVTPVSTVPAENTNLYAHYSSSVESDYTVEVYYQQSVDSEAYDLVSTTTAKAELNKVISQTISETGAYTFNAPKSVESSSAAGNTAVCDSEAKTLSIVNKQNTVIKLYYDIAQYTVTYVVKDSEGVQISGGVEQFKYDEKIVLPEPGDDTRVFDGWFMMDGAEETDTAVPEKMPANSIKVYAKFSELTAKLNRYILVDGSFVKYEGTGSDEYPYGEAIEKAYPDADVYEDQGYNVAGPYSDIEFKNAITGTLVMGNKDMNLYYKLEAKTYTIFFDLDNGSAPVAAEFKTGETIVAPEIDPDSKPGYTASGEWDDNGTIIGQPMAPEYAELAGPITYIWIEDNYTITFAYVIDGTETVIDDGVVYDYFLYGDSLDCPDDLAVEAEIPDGYTFRFWSETPDGVELDFDAYQVTEDATIYAVLEPDTVTVEFFDGETSLLKKEDAKVGQTIDFAPEVEDLIIWANKADNSVMPDKVPAGGASYYVVRKDTPVDTKTVTYYVDGVPTTEEFIVGSRISLEEPVKPGWEFFGWYLGETDSEDNEKMPDVMPDEDIVVHARLAECDYNVKYYVLRNGASELEYAGSLTAKYGDTIERDLANVGDSASHFELDDNDVDGPYSDVTFSKDAPATMPDKSINLYYRLSAKTLSVKFNLGETTAAWSDGSNEITVSVASGDQITVPAEFEEIKAQALDVDSLEFAGWDEDPSIMTSELDGKVYTATWTLVAKYTVTFYDHNGVLITSDDYAEGYPVEEFDADQIIVDAGCKVIGWATEQGGAVVYAAGELAGTPVTADADYYAVVEKTTKLVAKDETSTAMVERAGVVETYNEDLEKVPYGVTSVVRTFEDSYGDYAEPDDTWFVYGLKVGIKAGELGDYVKVTNGGSFKVYKGETEIPAEAKVGTGAVIKVYDSEGAEVEQFFVVIYGDVDGKSNINGTDRSVVSADIENRTWSDKNSEEFVPCKFRAADLDQKGNVNGTDRSNFTSFIEGSKTVNQITGRAE